MIDVTVLDTGDTAEADTPEEALLAAKTLGREAYDLGIAHPQIRFVNAVTGDIIRVCSLRSLTR